VNDNYLLKNPDLGLFAFFDRREGKNAAKNWQDDLVRRLRMPQGDTEHEVEDAKSLRCSELYDLQDSIVVYISVGLKGSYPPEVWQKFSEKVLGENWQKLPNAPSFWGISLFFGAIFDSLPSDDEQKSWLTHITLPTELDQGSEPICSSYAWGKVWQLSGTLDLKKTVPQVYTALFLSQYEEKVQNRLFSEGYNSLGFLELNLNKAYYQLKPFYQDRSHKGEDSSNWEAHLDTLEKTLNDLLSQLSQPNAIENYENLSSRLDDLWNDYVTFHSWAKQIEALKQTITLNKHNYQETATNLELLNQNQNSCVFNANLRKLERACHQLDADIHYNETSLARLTVGLETVRSKIDLLSIEIKHRDEIDHRYNERALTWAAMLLGLTQIYPIFQDIMNYFPFCQQDIWLCSQAWRMAIDTIVLLIFIIAFWRLYKWWVENKPR